MFFSERTVWPYRLRHGESALVVSMPHVGTFVPHSVGRQLSDCAARRADTDWHLPRLYDFLASLDATVIVANYSRYFVDVNRPPDGSNLYPGRDTPRLCPVDTFDSQPLYRRGDPGGEEIARRVAAVWRPYHARLEREIERVRAGHGALLLWDAHSIVSVMPRLFEGKLDDLNFGTAGGASCDPAISKALAVVAARHPWATSVVDGRFKGGYITRRYGEPARGVHAVQLEMAESLYMREESPYTFDEARAGRLRPLLRELVETAVNHVPRRPL